MVEFTLIVAATKDLGIGLGGKLPWRIAKDMAFFKTVTTHIPHSFNNEGRNALIMGRVTWESIPNKFRPLSDRLNIIVSRNAAYQTNVENVEPPSTILVSSIEDAFSAVNPQQHPRVFVIGGAQMYKEAIKHAKCTRILLTRITSNVNCDTFFPAIDDAEFRLATHQELEAFVEQDVMQGVQTHGDHQFEFTMYIRQSKAGGDTDCPTS